LMEPFLYAKAFLFIRLAGQVFYKQIVIHNAPPFFISKNLKISTTDSRTPQVSASSASELSPSGFQPFSPISPVLQQFPCISGLQTGSDGKRPRIVEAVLRGLSGYAPEVLPQPGACPPAGYPAL